MQEWFWLPKDEVLSGFAREKKGLTPGRRRPGFVNTGENVILERKKTPWWQVFFGAV